MRISVLKRDKIISLNLPAIVGGNFWVEDKDLKNKKRNLINIMI